MHLAETRGAGRSGGGLPAFFGFTYLAVLGLAAAYLGRVPAWDLRTVMFAAGAVPTYAAFYLLPALLLTLGAWGAGRLAARRGRGGRWAGALVALVAVSATGCTSILLFADLFIHRLYGFHLNGFVWNLIRTPGGIDSLGGGAATTATFAAMAAGFFLFQAVLLAAARRLPLLAGWRPGRRTFRWGLAALVLLSAGERATYAVSEFQGHAGVTEAAATLPLYCPLTIHNLARRLGYEVPRRARLAVEVRAARLAYPARPLRVEPPAHPLNVVVLVAESLRADMLTPEIMPRTWRFAARAHRFTRHYSGGNGTRMALFSLFYGLYGSYWFPFLELRREPVWMEVLRRQRYQFFLYTGQSFTYPELDKTVFARVPRRLLHPTPPGYGWERDRKNTADLVAAIHGRDRRRPFFAFLFFESTHARYSFPEESIIRRPYLRNFNYATMDLARDIGLIRNRYVNAAHHVDGQVGRILDALEREGLLKDTMVVITGDHGEEFMEKGHWGHNSEFTEEQTRVPLVLWVPGTGSGTVDRMTSHLDVAPTLLPRLGVRNPASDYSLGFDLLGPRRRTYTVICDWDRVAYVGMDYKAVIPVKTSALMRNRVTTADDRPLPDAATFLSGHRDVLVRLMQELRRFQRQG
ncbi:sulfatase-like hydrolase/transferase [Dissulfurirhabdus thermomarina]|uniref:Sulfatase-like hydrolase/transferase n=1 Tax=Dissulfurirhabdus thermomarina TaxID=1765737 RepID=A0A6N9TNP9_DISTH|nr:sulfatase-like hydrolase/transferase [Dissulfurirhabdus thermomarina]NDY42779.1 sulfatase-like hydrolase/transferase [Dissulfurirhabdus thermomarina]NMX22625.1 sulfatase-like hydrolase/transferase [Dissulfurirhabdus thermomarina]